MHTSSGDGACTGACFTYRISNQGRHLSEPGHGPNYVVNNAFTYTAWYNGDGTGATTLYGAAQNYMGPGSAGSSTGQQFILTEGALPTANFTATTFPGTVAGSVSLASLHQ